MPELAGGEEGEYVLRIRGDSMKNAGILEDDFVVVRPQDTAADGEIVVALVGEEATVKRFFREDDHVRLQPENETHEPIRSREVRGARARRRRPAEGGMSALLTPRRPRRGGASRPDRRPRRSRCSARCPPVPPAPAARPEPRRARHARPQGRGALHRRARGRRDRRADPASAHRQGPTLDDLVAGAWEGLLAGAPAALPACARRR